MVGRLQKNSLLPGSMLYRSLQLVVQSADASVISAAETAVNLVEAGGIVARGYKHLDLTAVVGVGILEESDLIGQHFALI